ncbi:MAG: hypothetical protein ACTHU0_14495 [Kofleriaceae bacterium]
MFNSTISIAAGACPGLPAQVAAPARSYTEVAPDIDREALACCARGVYQRALLAGTEAWSGATLQGAARRYGYWYARSRANLIERIERAGISVELERRKHGRIVAVVG